MPIYEYRCENGHTFEVIQRMADEPVEACEECGAPVERVFHPVAVHFKGSGFYTTDYAKKSKAGAGTGKDGDDSGSGGDSGAESKGDSAKSGAKSDSKSDAKSSGSGSGDKAKAASKSSD